MLKLLYAFHSHYCCNTTKSDNNNTSNDKLFSPPPMNFQSSKEMKKYNYFHFYEKTLQVARNANLVTKIQQEDIQRSPYNKHFFSK